MSHQSLVGSLLKVEYDLYIPGNDFIVNLFTPVSSSVNASYFFYSIYVRQDEIRDYSSGTANRYLINILENINFNSYERIRLTFDIANEKFYLYETNSSYTLLNLLAVAPMPIVHSGFYIPGFSGVSINQNNRLKRVIVEKYI